MIFQAEEIDVPVNWDSLLNCLEQMKRSLPSKRFLLKDISPLEVFLQVARGNACLNDALENIRSQQERKRK